MEQLTTYSCNASNGLQGGTFKSGKIERREQKSGTVDCVFLHQQNDVGLWLRTKLSCSSNPSDIGHPVDYGTDYLSDYNNDRRPEHRLLADWSRNDECHPQAGYLQTGISYGPNVHTEKDKSKIHLNSTTFAHIAFSGVFVTDRATVQPRWQQAKPAHTDFDLCYCCRTAACSTSLPFKWSPTL